VWALVYRAHIGDDFDVIEIIYEGWVAVEELWKKICLFECEIWTGH
jgi:hypothetical protein